MRVHALHLRRLKHALHRTVACLLVALSASAVSAENCPDFFRFVDFGLEGRDGTLHRGGPIFRAESFAGQPFLVKGSSRCLSVKDIAKDGHGNPIPIASHVEYEPRKTGIDLFELSISAVGDTKLATEASASRHHTTLELPDSKITRGQDYLCASLPHVGSLSCQVVSPVAGAATLVIYCDTDTCTMPALALSQRLLVRAAWEGQALYLNNPEIAGSEIAEKVSRIFGFLKPLSSSL